VDDQLNDSAAVTVYSRPGCPYCMKLKFGLRRSRVPFREVNIWNDPSAAAFVRSVANGNETVPTVTIGEVSLVNPSARRVRELSRITT
jgi:glutaredoxin-like protein